MNINFEKNFHLTLTPGEALWLNSQLVDAIDRLFDERKMAEVIYDMEDPDDAASFRKNYQDPIDFNLSLRESLMKFRQYRLSVEAEEERKNG